MSEVNKESENCWDFWDCPENKRNDCLVYKKGLGRACWYVPSYARAKVKRDFKHCWECSWYSKINTTFNSAS